MKQSNLQLRESTVVAAAVVVAAQVQTKIGKI